MPLCYLGKMEPSVDFVLQLATILLAVFFILSLLFNSLRKKTKQQVNERSDVPIVSRCTHRYKR